MKNIYRNKFNRERNLPLYVGKVTRKWVVESARGGMTMSAIAIQAGVSRERIRQIAKSEGFISRLDPQTIQRKKEIRQQKVNDEVRKRSERARLRNEIRQRRREKYVLSITDLSCLWKQGRSIKEISRHTGNTSSCIAHKIHIGRKIFGTEDFPIRSERTNLPIPRGLRRIWNKGDLTRIDLALRYKVSVKQVICWLDQGRSRKGPDAYRLRLHRDIYSRQPGESLMALRARLRSLLEPANAKWNSDLTTSIDELAQLIGVSVNRMRSLIATARAKLGTRWFQKRTSKMGQQLRKERAVKELATVAVLWHEGFRIEDIAKQVKVNSTQLARKIMAARKLCGEELFPRRHLATKDVEKRNQHASSLWKSGFSLTEISDQVGIKVGLLRYLITCSRGRGLSLFPLRS